MKEKLKAVRPGKLISNPRPDKVGGLQNASLEELAREMLVRIGEDPLREGIVNTPLRYSKAMTYLTHGYSKQPSEVLKGAIYTVGYDQMVIVKDVEMFSMCEHHMLPFFGKVHIAYIPNGKVIGISNIPYLVEIFARRLQVQERLTKQLAEAVQEIIEPNGVGVVIEARHLCMMMRGVEKQHSAAVTSAMLGSFRRQATRNEFLSLLNQKGSSSF